MPHCDVLCESVPGSSSICCFTWHVCILLRGTCIIWKCPGGPEVSLSPEPMWLLPAHPVFLLLFHINTPSSIFTTIRLNMMILGTHTVIRWRKQFLSLLWVCVLKLGSGLQLQPEKSLLLGARYSAIAPRLRAERQVGRQTGLWGQSRRGSCQPSHSFLWIHTEYSISSPARCSDQSLRNSWRTKCSR